MLVVFAHQVLTEIEQQWENVMIAVEELQTQIVEVDPHPIAFLALQESMPCLAQLLVQIAYLDLILIVSLLHALYAI